MQAVIKAFGLFQFICKLHQRIRYRCIEHHVRAGNGIIGANHAKFKFIAGKGEGGGAVPVGCVTGEPGQNIGPKANMLPLSSFIGSVFLYGIENSSQFISQEDGNHGGRCFICSKTMIIACGCYTESKQILIIIYSLNDGHQEEQKLRILVWGFTGRKQVDPRVGRHGPVVVLSAPVDARKGFLMEQADKRVLSRYLLHNLHGKLVFISCHVGGGVNHRKLMLCRGDLIVLCFGIDAKLPQLLVQFFHKSLYPGLD